MSERKCNSCVYATRDGNCVSWDCEYINIREAANAWKEKKEREKDGRLNQPGESD